MLKWQVENTPRSEIITDAVAGSLKTHPVNSMVGRRGFPQAERDIKRCGDVYVSYNVIQNGGQQSFVGGLQIFSDKSQTSLIAGASKIYPLHGTFFNLSEEERREHISQRRTVIEYLRMRFDRSEGVRSMRPRLSPILKVNLVEIVGDLHEKDAF